MKKLNETEIETFYTLVDNNNKHIIDFHDVEELIKYAKSYAYQHYNCDFKDLIAHSKKCVMVKVDCYIGNPYTRWKNTFWRHATYKNMFVMDSVGNLIDIFNLQKTMLSLKPSRYEGKTRHVNIRSLMYDRIHESCIIRGENINKIKTTYSILKSKWSYDGDVRYYHYQIGYHRHPKTMGAHRAIAGVERDEGEPKFRGKRCNKNLPHSWNDIPAGVYYKDKSWKHNSKRRKQWKVKL